MTTPCDIKKRREIMFHEFPAGQCELALGLLSGLPELEVRQTAPRTLEIAYCVDHYTLEAIESALESQGFHLFSTLIGRIKRALIYYCERTQIDNMSSAEIPSKNFNAFVSDWAKRPHGDHDATPAEWRQYK